VAGECRPLCSCVDAPPDEHSLRQHAHLVLAEPGAVPLVGHGRQSFGGWTKTFTDPRLCAAIVDRLTFGGNIIETGTDSYRLAATRARAAQQAAAVAAS
jgi:IstB-like ATP binding protein